LVACGAMILLVTLGGVWRRRHPRCSRPPALGLRLRLRLRLRRLASVMRRRRATLVAIGMRQRQRWRWRRWRRRWRASVMRASLSSLAILCAWWPTVVAVVAVVAVVLWRRCAAIITVVVAVIVVARCGASSVVRLRWRTATVMATLMAALMATLMAAIMATLILRWWRATLLLGRATLVPLRWVVVVRWMVVRWMVVRWMVVRWGGAARYPCGRQVVRWRWRWRRWWRPSGTRLGGPSILLLPRLQLLR